MFRFFFFLVASTLLLACQPNTADQQEVDQPMIKTSSLAYDEPHRPQYHFTPPTQWMNDPNGMVYYEGEYHLFYQHYPDNNVWGPMHWGHAVSEDLVNWQHLPIALYPDSLGYIFSGSAVIDWNNSSGLAPEGEIPMIAIFTYHDMAGEKSGANDFQTQGIAYSLDNGRTWTKYEGNPVIPNPGLRDFRDPKVFWHDASESWVMIFARGDQVQLYRSPNLIDWTLASEFGVDQASHDGVWECPDLFPLKVPGSDIEKWVMIVSLGRGGPNGGSGTMYFIGDFDGTTFTNSNPAETVLWLDYGTDNYAGVSWSDVPESDGRRLFMGWMSNWHYATVVPTEKWRSAMTIARELQLKQTELGLRLASIPLAEQAKLRSDTHQIAAGELDGERMLASDSRLAELLLEFEYNPAAPPSKLGVRFSNSLGEEYLLGLDLTSYEFFTDRRNAGKTDFSEHFAKLHKAPRMRSSNTLDLHIYLDHSSIEFFADGHEIVFTDIFFPNEPFSEIQAFSEGGKTTLTAGIIHPLKKMQITQIAH
ncbi:MAG: glycoside hydrolase family 32 protein [Bacteroidota bacterium]